MHGSVVGAEKQIPAIQRRQEVVWVASNQREVRAELGDQFRLHDAKQVRAGGSAKTWGFGEWIFRFSGPADDRFFFQHSDAQALARKERGGDEAVMASADDGDVGGGFGHGVDCGSWGVNVEEDPLTLPSPPEY